MKIKLELFGASRDFSNNDYLEFNIKEQLEIKDFRKEIINYLDKNFKGNESFIKIVKNSVFCSENNNIINDDFKIIKDQKIGIIPPIGGG
ncbi:molybdopterin biosynthesis protein MoeD [Candidatus Pelagibacter sp.]|jgi:molybdopterin synthase sulfur carrier subunit|uniref:molybdopterin biosynthesis protein MoeD n=1 Tax=Candidatus Pelagibacter sp. Uisw_094 TaxID=3230980 RepID=UPI002337939B|nr:molybdopterin biosynthesis protein MoeD [Candidatus Pelagibacter sp.]